MILLPSTVLELVDIFLGRVEDDLGFRLLEAMSWSADDTKVGRHGLRTSLLLREVQGEVSHRDEVEGNASQAALTIDSGIPDLDVMFRSFGEIQHLSRSRSRTLSSKVHSCL